MPKDEGKNLGYHWRRSAGVYDAPGATTKGNASTTSSDVTGLSGKTSSKGSTKK